jgi:hypothetical protein
MSRPDHPQLGSTLEEALPVVLGLLDQIYDLRRRVRELGEAIELTTTGETRRALVRHLTSVRSE